MKIHIDTSTAQEQAKAQKTKASPSAKKSGSGGTTPKKSTPASSAPPTPAPVKPKPIPKGPKKETKAPADVAAARARQSSVLAAREQRETQGNLKGPSRDVDAGTGFGFQTYPFL